MGARRLERVLALVRRHRPGLRLVDKRTLPAARFVAWVVRPLAPDFADGTTTVLGDRVFLPRAPDEIDPDQLAAILCHELVHQLDQASYPLFYVSYVLGPPLPLLRTARADWERRAYAVDLMLAHHDRGERGLHHLLEWLVDVFAGPTYGWMWIGRDAARTYLQPVVDEVLGGALQRREPYRSILAAWTGPD
ncbi:MAG: hypothetical protein H6738_14470 [Alphaproteobacteria bacterium]|nr:hypothetical protein [Alphaproteobacteria bacterium]MCB9697979.1 hypothetical protein [Alphaproteobacteria bacterium]